MLERFGHGGDLLTAQELYGDVADDFIDFSANMNPFGPPPCVAELLGRYGEMIRHYPDPAVRGLRGKLARHHGVESSNILVGNGAAELIDLVCRLLRPAHTILAQPCFVEYGDAAEKSGSSIAAIVLKADNEFRLTEQMVRGKLASLREAGIEGGTTLWFFGSPNNPTGKLVDPAIIRLLLHEGERVVIDEAFMDFVPEGDTYSLVKEAAAHERLFVIRSMTKFYAIPGIRVGYMVGTPELISALQKLQIPWSVNSLAQAIGEAVLEEHEYSRSTLHYVAAERQWLGDGLSSIGLEVHESAANYLLVSIPPHYGWTAGSLQQALGSRGILIRDASRFQGLDASYCRLAVRLREDNVKLLQALRDLLQPNSDTEGKA
ncbi:threonine-phosphate decarboxylase CobD [Paenibacillus oenotherae]|uniref:threonine-phosphate decarboxylase n=1 Tax=Paenibacillus oenotherae TaxID=1435645 RepID=A0ABS7D0B6_9BACL|nr:threonine-phosphate decarboxylase CobD [Paenibacillus oenotherae]MBW7473186.1 threonine-phosphate decarboxylase CobD [Paenibacillus oenotherae]